VPLLGVPAAIALKDAYDDATAPSYYLKQRFDSYSRSRVYTQKKIN
jgi:hypothetical protein